MKVLINERLSEHKYKTPEGYLICQDAVLARTGKQTYRRNEVFNDSSDEEIQIDRKPEEVFSEKTLASFENKPVTVEHPDEDVNINNYKDYAVGFVRDVHKGINEDGQDVILGTLVITDAKTIEEIENGEHTDLSCGYDCDIVDEDNPQQRNIRGNHVALCQCGRAGNAHIVDSVNDDDFVLLDLAIELVKKFGKQLKKETIQKYISNEKMEEMIKILNKMNVHIVDNRNLFQNDSLDISKAERKVVDLAIEYRKKINQNPSEKKIRLWEFERQLEDIFDNTLDKDKEKLKMIINKQRRDMEGFVNSIKDAATAVYRATYKYSDNVFSAVMVRANSEKEAEDKFRKRKPDFANKIVGTTPMSEWDVQSYTKRGMSILDENEVNDSVNITKSTKNDRDQIVYTMQSNVDRNLYFYIGKDMSMKEGNFSYNRYDMNGTSPEELKQELEKNGWHQVGRGPAPFIDSIDLSNVEDSKDETKRDIIRQLAKLEQEGKTHSEEYSKLENKLKEINSIKDETPQEEVDKSIVNGYEDFKKKMKNDSYTVKYTKDGITHIHKIKANSALDAIMKVKKLTKDGNHVVKDSPIDTILANWGFAYLKGDKVQQWHFRYDDDKEFRKAVQNLREVLPKNILSSSNDGKRTVSVLMDSVKDNGHKAVIFANNVLKELGKNNSIGKYDRIVQAIRSLYSESLLPDDKLKEAIRREIPRLLKKYNLEDSIKDTDRMTAYNKAVAMLKTHTKAFAVIYGIQRGKEPHLFFDTPIIKNSQKEIEDFSKSFYGSNGGVNKTIVYVVYKSQL